MAIVNRGLDASEQRKVFKDSKNALATGITTVLCVVPYASVLEGAMLAAFGVSGSPTYTLAVNRFIAGSGFTTWAVSGAEAPAVFGTSGVLARGMSLLASGSTLLNLMPNDLLTYTSGASNAAATVGIAVVLRPIQDVKKHFALDV